MINFLAFYARYHIYTGVKKVFGKKSNKYIMIFLGKYPENLKHGLKPIIDNEHDFRFTFGPASLILVFNSKQTVRELNLTFGKVYGEYTDAFFLFDITKAEYGKHCINIISKNLFEPSVVNLTNDEKIDKVHYLIQAIIRMRVALLNGIERGEIDENQPMDVADEITDESIGEIDMKQIDSIIDKVKEVGYDQLTEEEQNIYNKIFKK